MLGDKARKAKQRYDDVVAELELDRFDNNKKRMLVYYCLGHGNISIACKNAKLSRQTFYNWFTAGNSLYDPDFAKMTEFIDEIALDFTESKLMENIAKGKENSVFFKLNNHGHKRGYHKRLDITTDGKPITEKIDYKKISKAALEEIAKSSGSTGAESKGSKD